MADKVELKSEPAKAPASTIEAKVQPPKGDTQQVTVDTTQKPAEPAKTDERPSWLPEEFKTPEEMAEAYKKTKAPAEQPKVDEKKTEEAVAKAGLDMPQLDAEWRASGKLSDDSLKKLEKAGITKAMVDAYIEGQQAKGAAITKRLAESVGGDEELKATLEWASTSLSEAEIAATNKMLQSGDEDQARLALQGLHSRRQQVTGVEPKFIAGRSRGSNDGPLPYESTQQMIKDMQSFQYKKDPAFREAVAKRIGVSKF